ncbi:B12-binding domain-containing radical SAM protein [Acidobacteria bacterium AH-259-G07]|nr:B12-binding domain-containing radical SAM protein [Acidobacteria bacterium AH-259-G07]
MQMDILLTHGYFLQGDPHEQGIMKPYPPLGLLYISSYLKSKGFQVAVFDTTFSTREALEGFIEQQHPSIVGIYCNLVTRHSVLDLISLCKRYGCEVVLGGPEPANYAEEYLARGTDAVVLGEGELTLEELLTRRAESGRKELGEIAGIVFRDGNGSIVRTPPRPHIKDLDAQPFPDRDAIDIRRYMKVWREHHGLGAVSLITSRGCPYTCSWCSHSVFGYSHRARSPQNVADEVELILAQYQPDMLWYGDDVFTINRRWFFAYAQELKRRGLKIPFETISREDRLDEDIIQTLADMGCFRLWIGSESGSQRILDAMQRRTSAERVRHIVHLLQEYGIEAGLFIMLGYEGESIHDIEVTVDHLKQVNPDVFLTTVAYPIKGTPYFDEVADRIIPLKPWEAGSDRDLTVAGRHSRRFYSFATRWMLGEVLYHKERFAPARDYVQMTKAAINAKIGRVGMLLTQLQKESCG